jgi:hypothetical protein
MVNSLLGLILGCSHKKTTFPITPRKKTRPGQFRSTKGTYIVCLDCGKEFDYNWKEMRIGGPVRELRALPNAVQPEQPVTHH